MAIVLKVLPYLRLVNRFDQTLYMAMVRVVLARSGVAVNGRPLWIAPSVYLDASSNGAISIGDRVVISESVRVLTHDYSLDRVAEGLGELPRDHELVRFASVTIEDRAFIGIGATLLPGVTVGRGAIVGAGSVVAASVPPETVAAGNPARQVMTTAEFWSRRRGDYVVKKRRR